MKSKRLMTLDDQNADPFDDLRDDQKDWHPT
jgi:hypothetical protein